MTAKINRNHFFLLLALFLLTAGLYARTAGFGFVDFDDSKYIYENPHLKTGLNLTSLHWAFTTGYFSNWHPVTWLTYLSSVAVFGIRPGPIHVINLLLHAGSACLLFEFLRYTTGNRWAAIVTAALWAWHPLRVESIAWISETKDTLSAFFFLLTLLAYAHYAAQSNWKRYLAVSAAFLLALASKPTVVTLPAVLLLIDYWPLNRWRSPKAIGRLILEKIPWLLMALATAALTYKSQHVGTSVKLMKWFPLSSRLENSVVSLFLYIQKFFWPAALSVFYPHPNLIGRPIPPWQWGAAIAGLLLISAVTAFHRKTLSFLWIGWLWFLGTIIPMIGIIQVGEQRMADRYTLIPSIGLTIGVVYAVATLVKKFPRMTRSAGVLAGIILLALWCASWRQIGYWHDTYALFTHADEVTRDNYLARSGRARCLQQSGENPVEALSLARSSLAICSATPHQYYVLARILEQQGNDSEALVEYITAAKLDPGNAGVFNDLGGLLVKMGRNDAAMVEFRRAIHLDPTLTDARHNLALLLAGRNEYEQAIAQWREAIRLDPKNGAFHGWLAEALRLHGDNAGAVAQYQTAIALGEHNPVWEANLVWLVATNPRSSPEEVRKVIPIGQNACDAPGHRQPFFQDALGIALSRAGRFDEAAAVAAQGAALADALHEPQMAAAIRARATSYRAGVPFMLRTEK